MADGTKKLYRSRDDRWLAGVCGGLGDYFGVDPILVRVLFILFGAAVGGGLIIYIILWIIMPEEPGIVEKGDFTDAGLEAEPEPEPEKEPESEPEEDSNE